MFEPILMHPKQASDELAAPGDYFVVEKRGLSDAEYTAREVGLKDSFTPKNFISKILYRWKYGHTPIELTPKYREAIKPLVALRATWPNFRALLVVCPFCRQPFSTGPGHAILDAGNPLLTVTPDITCPYGKQGMKIKDGTLRPTEK